VKYDIELLEKQEKSDDIIYKLSLLYRYYDLYSKEKKLLDDAVSLGQNSKYVAKRLQWHSLPMSEKCVPRKKFNAERLTTPKQESVDQLCFVLGGDSRYFQMIYECVQSIKATKNYKEVPIFLMDGGFTDDDRNRAAPLVDKILDMSEHASLLENITPLDATLGRCFADKLFPGFRFYFFLDGDTWIHDENALDRILCMTEQYGISVIQCENWFYKDSYLYENKHLIDKDSEAIKDNLYVNSGIFCIDAERDYFSNMQLHIVKTIKTRSYKYSLDEAALCYLVHTNCTQKDIFINMTRKNHYILFFGYPVVYKDNHFLYIYYQGKEYPLGIMHTKGTYNHDKFYYFPTQRVITSLDTPDKIESQRHLSEFTYNNFGNEKTYNREVCPFNILEENSKSFPNQTEFSVRYLVWPWRDKTEVKKKILSKELSHV